MNKQEHTIEYILPAEAVDLSYLYKCLKEPKDEIKPLWCNLDSDSQYYHVEIHSMDVCDNDCCSEEVNTYVCQICNSDVPQMYYREHNESEPHLAFKRICENVLERVSKQLNMIAPYNYPSNDTFCCHTCNKVVKIHNRSKHEQSEYHAKAVERLQVLNDFYKIFLNIDDDDANSYADSVVSRNNPVNDHIKLQNSNISNSSFFSLDDRESDYESEDSSFVSTSRSLEVESPIEREEKGVLNFDKPVTETELPKDMSLETYFKAVINKFNLMISPPHTEGDNIFVKNSTGSKLKVSREHFHSFTKVCDKIYCQICKCVPEDVRTHEVKERHVMRIFKTINENFAREINYVYSHCLVCNEVIGTNSDHHRINDTHKTILNQNNLPTSPAKSEVGTPKTFCEICSIPIHTHNFLGHRGGRAHQMKENRLLEQNNINKIENDQYYCKVCKVNINFNALYTHVNEEPHITRNDEYNKTDISSEFCYACNVNVPKKCMAEDSEGSSHKKVQSLITEPNTNNNNVIKIKNESQIANKNNDIINNSNNPGTSNKTVKKAAQPNENSSALAKTDYSKLFKNTNIPNLILCKVCKKSVPNSTKNIKEHVNGTVHKTQLNELYKYFDSTDCKKAMFICKVCGVLTPKNSVDVIEHIDNENHKHNFEKLLTYNKISEIGSDLYNCVPCKHWFIIDPFTHINGKIHTDNFMEKYVSEVKALQLLKFPNKAYGGEGILYKNLLSNNQIVKQKNGYFHCNICKQYTIMEVCHILVDTHKLAKKNKGK